MQSSMMQQAVVKCLDWDEVMHTSGKAHFVYYAIIQ